MTWLPETIDMRGQPLDTDVIRQWFRRFQRMLDAPPAPEQWFLAPLQAFDLVMSEPPRTPFGTMDWSRIVHMGGERNEGLAALVDEERARRRRLLRRRRAQLRRQKRGRR
jgi:hypothetical protein